MGVLIWTGQLTKLNADASSFIDGLGLEFLTGT